MFTVFVDNASFLCAAGLQPVSQYEQERAKNIARNKAELAKLGLGSGGTALLPLPASRRGRPARRSRLELAVAADAPSAPARRSSRLAGFVGAGDTSTQAEAYSMLAGAAVSSEQLPHHLLHLSSLRSLRSTSP